MSDLKTLTDRIDTLEARLTFQDDTIETLNKTITEQWAKIDALTRQLVHLNERLQEAESQMPGPRMNRRRTTERGHRSTPINLRSVLAGDAARGDGCTRSRGRTPETIAGLRRASVHVVVRNSVAGLGRMLVVRRRVEFIAHGRLR